MASALSALSAAPAGNGSYSSTLTIQEVDSATGSSPRSLVLQGPSLPLQGAGWGFANKLVTTWYPGNGAEGAQQVLMPTELPSTWNGDWRRTMMGNIPAIYTDETGSVTSIVDPFVLWTAFETIARGGLRLRVTWAVDGSTSDKQGKIVREGRCAELSIKAIRLQDIEWTAKFDWVSRGAKTQKASAVRDSSLTAGVAALSAATLNLSALASQLQSLASAPLRAFNSLLGSVSNTVGQLQALANVALTLKNEPSQIGHSASMFMRNLSNTVNLYEDQLSRTPAETRTPKPQSVGAMLAALNASNSTGDAANAVAQQASNLNVQLRAAVYPPALSGAMTVQTTTGTVSNVETIYVTKDGDTPQRISQRFYSTPDHAVDILQANRLPWYQAKFPKGKGLVIPILTTAPQTS
jgi:hypothetical protein